MAVRTKNDGANGNGTLHGRIPNLVPPGLMASEKILIPMPKMEVIQMTLRGIAPLVIRAWDEKTQQQLADKQSTNTKTKKAREARQPDDVMNAAKYVSTEGWDGVPAAAFKAAMVRAVDLLNLSKSDMNMTRAALCIFVKHDGMEKPRKQLGNMATVSTRLLKIIGPPAKNYPKMQPTASGTPYMSYRPMYDPWSVILRVEFNSLLLSAEDIVNLAATAGYFVGVGEHRPSARESRTGEYGRWEIESKK